MTTLARILLVISLPVGSALVFIPKLSFDRAMPLPMGPSTGELFEPRMDRILHMVGAMVLLWLLTQARLFGRAHPRIGNAVVIAVLAMMGPGVELIQENLGRGFEWGDCVAHELGLLLGLLLGGAHVWAGLGTRDSGLREDQSPAIPKPRAPQPRSPASTDFVRHSRTVGVLTLASRFTGLVRDSAIGAVFGLSWISSAFMVGFMVPNLFRRLFGEGALASAFIPRYTALRHSDPMLAQRFASLCLAVLAVVVGALVIVVELGLGATILARDWSQQATLTMQLTMAMLPYAPLVCLVALFGGMLQVHGKFGAPAAAPVLLNLFMIAALVFVGLMQWGQDDPRRAVFIIACSVVLAGFVQLAWLGLATTNIVPLTRDFTGAKPAFRTMAATMLPMVIGLAVFQFNALTDLLIAIGLSPREGGPEKLHAFGHVLDYPVAHAGDATALVFAQRLYQFPLGVFGIAIATAIFPALARAAHTAQQDFQTILKQGLRLTVFIGLPASAGLILVRLPLVRVIFEHRSFTFEDSERVAFILIGYAAAVWAYSMTHVLTRAFYAREDARTPLRITVVMVAFNLTLNLILVWFLGAAGLAWSTAISAACQVVLLMLAVRRYAGTPIDGHVVLAWLRTAALTALMIAAVLPLQGKFDSALVQLFATVIAGACVFAIGAWLTRADELKWLLHRGTREIQ